jgi:hypothetical protein
MSCYKPCRCTNDASADNYQSSCLGFTPEGGFQESDAVSGDGIDRVADDWNGMEWGAFGGPAAREVCLWVQLQREFRRRNLLSAVAVRRLDALGFKWEPEVGILSLLSSQIVRKRLMAAVHVQRLFTFILEAWKRDSWLPPVGCDWALNY